MFPLSPGGSQLPSLYKIETPSSWKEPSLCLAGQRASCSVLLIYVALPERILCFLDCFPACVFKVSQT